MTKRSFLVPLFGLFCYLTTAVSAYAISNPLAVPNNKIGIHILFVTELPQAAQLVNANGGDWGYVTIPMQANDMNAGKWQHFMDQAKILHVVPIIRLATQSDPSNSAIWRKQTAEDIINFGNFLNSLNWPTRNRYVIIFNEVNRGDEWGGAANPKEYAEMLSFAVSVFKSKSPDFFIISAGLDNAAPNQSTTFINEYDFMRQMNAAVPGIFNQIDGFSSHSYPNPGFAQAPNTTSPTGTGSFLLERKLIRSLSTKDIPVFITETGWADGNIFENLKLTYFQQALDTIWNDPNIVALTPFLLDADGGPFQKFSFLNKDGTTTRQYQLLHDYPKVAGAPLMPIRVLAAETHPAGKDSLAGNTPPKTGTLVNTSPFFATIQGWLHTVFRFK